MDSGSKCLRRTLSAVLMPALVLSGCATGWRRISLDDPRALAAQRQVQVWRHGQAVRLRDPVVQGDSLRGIPADQPPTCAGCSVTILRADVDSVRIFEQGTSASEFVLTVGAAGVLAYLALRSLAGGS